MHKRSFLSALAAALLACSVGVTNGMAGTEIVTSDAGTFNFTLTSNGHGLVSIHDTLALLTTINGNVPVGGPVVATFPDITSSATLLVSAPPVTTYSWAGSSSKTFGDGTGSNATLQYSLTSAVAINPSFLNIYGTVTGVTSPHLETTGTSPTIYDFSKFESGGSMTETYTSTGANFASVIANGGTISGTGAFTESISSVPEPNSMALLGIGMTAMVAFRRYFRRDVTA
jgi:hypothetical protein